MSDVIKDGPGDSRSRNRDEPPATQKQSKQKQSKQKQSKSKRS